MGTFKLTLPNEFAYATECNLATLSSLLLKKSSPKSEVKRQTNICCRMLGCCRAEQGNIEWGNTSVKNFGRVEEILNGVKELQGTGLYTAVILDAALNAWIEKWHSK